MPIQVESFPLKYVLLFSLLFLLACDSSPTIEESDQETSLADAFRDDFYIGAALSKAHILKQNPAETALIAQEFSSITPENSMKWMYIHPQPDSFNFEVSDQFVQLGQSNYMYLLAHALIWHSQLAPWVEELKDSVTLRQAIEHHIQSIVGHHKGQIDGWDVVNEALNEDGSLRESLFYKILGKDYIKLAFDQAAKADPEADLFYNDYNICQPAKRAGTIRLLKDLQEQGTKIDGVGIQAHWGLDGPSLQVIEESILEYAALGLDVMFTELDITVLPNPWDLEGADVNQNFEGNPQMNPYPTGLPDSIQVQLADRYASIFELFLKHSDKISRITFWGLHDGHSWLNNWPIEGRTNYPLLFDRELARKLAYRKVLALKQMQESSK